MFSNCKLIPVCYRRCLVTAQGYQGTVAETELFCWCCQTTAACRRRIKTTLLLAVPRTSLSDSSDPITTPLFYAGICVILWRRFHSEGTTLQLLSYARHTKLSRS